MIKHGSVICMASDNSFVHCGFRESISVKSANPFKKYIANEPQAIKPNNEKKIAKIKRICILYKFNLYLLKFIPIEIKMILTGFVYMY